MSDPLASPRSKRHKKCEECSQDLIAAKVVVDKKTTYLCRACTQRVQKDNPDESLCQMCQGEPTVTTVEHEQQPLSLCAGCEKKHQKKKGDNGAAKSNGAGSNGGGGGDAFVQSGSDAQQGRRATMEDADISIDSLRDWFPDAVAALNCRRAALYAVYDGHGGQRVADACKALVHKRVCECAAFKENKMEMALEQAFEEADKEIMELCVEGDWTDGATGAVALVIDNKLWSANVGDSELVVARQKGDKLEAECLSIKHKPSDPEEKQRIVEAGGVVLFDRLGAQMAVSRSFGDKNHKAPHNGCEENHMSAVPYIASTDIGDVPFMILACDGLWDKFTYQDAVEFAAAEFAKKRTCEEVAQALAQESLTRESNDNVSVIVVKFDSLS